MHSVRLARLALLSAVCLIHLLVAGPSVSASRGLAPLSSTACPRLNGFTPSRGAPGTRVTLTGCGFTGVSNVTFHGLRASFRVTSQTQITTTVPAGASSGVIAVTTSTRILKSVYSFLVLRASPTVTLSSLAGPPASTIGITGAHFGSYEAVDVYFDSSDEALASTTGAGGFSILIQVPAAAIPGTHWVTGVGRHSGLSAQVSFQVQTNWTQFGFVAQHTRTNPYENVLSPANIAQLGVNWSAAIGGYVYSSPTVANGVVYIGSSDGSLYAFNAQTGAQLWTAATGATIYSSPAVANGVVYVGSYDKRLYAFNAQTGAQLWTAATGATIYSSPAVANGVVYVGSFDGSLYAYGLPSGQQFTHPGRPNPTNLRPNLRLHIQP